MARSPPATGHFLPLTDLRYFVRLALRSFRRDWFLTLSILLTLGVGIAASMTVFSILHVLSGDPIPEKSTRLYQPTISTGFVGMNSRPAMYSLSTAQQLLDQLQPPDRGAMMAQGFASGLTVPGGHKHSPVFLVFSSGSFFSLFDVPFLAGGPWNAGADATADHVIVLNPKVARELFGSTSPLGKIVILGGVSLRVVGVTGDWQPIPRFYDLNTGPGVAYQTSDNVYLPLKSIRDMNSEVFVSYGCSDAGAGQDIQRGHFAPFLGPDCSWLAVWDEILSPPGKAREEAFLAKLLAQLKKEGHALPTAASSMPNVLQMLDAAHVVPGDIRAYTVIGFLFLWLCVLSATGTLLGKFLRRSPEIGIRRALGASRMDILKQYLVESGVLGAASGLLGLLLSELSLTVIRHSPTYLAQVVSMSGPLLAATVSLAVLSGVIAGLLPAWRAARTDIGVIVKVT